MSEIVRTIIGQLCCQGLDKPALASLGFKCFVKMDENTVRLHFKRKKRIINVDIAYNFGSDLYDVSAHYIDSRTFEIKSRVIRDIYCDQLSSLCFELAECNFEIVLA